MGIFDNVVTNTEYVDNGDGTFTKWTKQGVVDTKKLKDEKALLESLQSFTSAQISKILNYSLYSDNKTIQQKVSERITAINAELAKVEK